MTDAVETFLTLMSDIPSRNKYLLEVLRNNVCEITFTKIDGSVRTMPCTLSTAHLPAKVLTETKTTRTFNPETISVFCTDKQEWRSFKTMNVTDVKILDV
jgi:hypothetical protein